MHCATVSDSPAAAIRRVTYAGMVINCLLAAAKAVCGVFCGSRALVADAVHSLSDLATDLAVVFGVRFWEAPPDDEHPYGHGKIQALVTLFIAAALLLTAWQLGKGAVLGCWLGAPQPVISGGVALSVAMVSIVVKELLYRWTAAVARRVKSPALMANAWHHRSDAFSSVPVAIAVALTAISPRLAIADSIGALVVAVFIVRVAGSIACSALQELTDVSIASKAAEVEAIALKVAGVKSVHRCRVRRYGGAFQADLHLQVAPVLSIVEAHRIAHAVKDALVADDHAGIADVVTHTEPFGGAERADSKDLQAEKGG